jgi:nucleoside-diphosphate-sugar epimerase
MERSLHPDSNVLVTGVTGLIGGEVFRRLLTRGHRGRLWALVRPNAGHSPAERILARLARSGDDYADLPAGVAPVAGDILCPDWGLPPADRDEIAASVDLIVHNAADTSFVAHRDTAKTNVEGVRRLIDFARACRRNPLVVYMSSASNVGRESGRCLSEGDGCRVANDHFNDYTRSKAVGEQILRDSGLPVLTLRPTIVLSDGLPDPTFARQILWCAPLTRSFEALPVDPAARLDLVDVGFVAETALRLMENGSRRHDCYHLSAGQSRCVTAGEVAACLDRLYGRRPLRLVRPAEWTPSVHRQFVRTRLQRRVFRALKVYLPFLNMDVVFDDARLRAEFPEDDLLPRKATEYLPPLLRLIRQKAALLEAAVP